MLDYLEGYLENIAVAATQMAATGTPLAELAASLAVSVDTVARQQTEIKRLKEHINALRKKGRISHIWSAEHRGQQLPQLQALCSGMTFSVAPPQSMLLRPTEKQKQNGLGNKAY